MTQTTTLRLGELLVGCGLLQPMQLQAALQDQFSAAQPIRLGELLVRNRWVSQQSVNYLLHWFEQAWINPGDPLGVHLVLSGMIGPSMLEDALDYQRQHGGQLGDILDRLGFCRKTHVEFFKQQIYDCAMSQVSDTVQEQPSAGESA